MTLLNYRYKRVGTEFNNLHRVLHRFQYYEKKQPRQQISIMSVFYKLQKEKKTKKVFGEF